MSRRQRRNHTPVFKAKVALAARDRSNVAFDVFFTHILMHELMHGLGPHNITVNGKETTVRQALQVSSSALEEAKADILGLYMVTRLQQQGDLPDAVLDDNYVTFLAGIIRSVRGTSATMTGATALLSVIASVMAQPPP